MTARTSSKGSGLKFSPWNLLLLIPLWVLITPLFNSQEPALFGMPFLYWAQFAGVLIGVLCTSVVYLMTRSHKPGKDTVEREAGE